MKSTSIGHGSFAIERIYEASPAEVFAAWADPETKAIWFIGPPEQWSVLERTMDFREGGKELLRGLFNQKMETLFTAHYHQIIADSRIVYTYDMHTGGKHHSLSLATVEIEPINKHARLVFTEQVAFLDGTEAAGGVSSRDHGTAAHLDRLGKYLRRGG